jgi:DHA1 family bicyclomycin/chloramphenicol resistance-like MFS transporter
MTKQSFTLLILILGSLTAIGPLAIDMYLPAFSAMAGYFSVKESEVQLSLASFFIGIAIGQIFYGPIVDRFGKKIPLLVGLTIFIISSAFCLIATDISQIITLRFIQALGSCACFVIMRAIVRDLFSPQESAKVFSYLMLIMGLAPIVAPFFGSLLLIKFSWKAIFVFLTLFGIVLVIGTIFFLPESKAGNKDDKISHAFRKYTGILKDKNFLYYCLTTGFAGAGMFCYIAGSPFVIIELFSVSPKHYSWIFGVNAFGLIVVSQINRHLLRYFEMKKILNWGLFFILTSSISLILIGIYSNYYQLNIWHIVLPIFIYVSCIGITNPNGTALSLANQYTHTGSASALLGTIQFSIAAFGAFLVSKFHNETAIPVLTAMGLCGIIAFLVNYFWQKKLKNKEIINLNSNIQN